MTEEERTNAKPKLQMRLESMEKIEDRVQQWMLLDEHWTRNNLNRYQQLDYAKKLFEEITKEIREAYQACPAYCGAE